MEHGGNEDKTLRFYPASLRYAVKYKDAAERRTSGTSEEGGVESPGRDEGWLDADDDDVGGDEPFSVEGAQVAKTTMLGKEGSSAKTLDDAGENGEMELFLEKRFDWAGRDDGREEFRRDEVLLRRTHRTEKLGVPFRRKLFLDRSIKKPKRST